MVKKIIMKQVTNAISTELTSSISNIDGLISASDDITPTIEFNNIEGHVSESNDSKVSSEIKNYNGTYQSEDDISLSGTITRNQSSTVVKLNF